MSFTADLEDIGHEFWQANPHLEPIYGCYVNRLKSFIPIGSTVYIRRTPDSPPEIALITDSISPDSAEVNLFRSLDLSCERTAQRISSLAELSDVGILQTHNLPELFLSPDTIKINPSMIRGLVYVLSVDYLRTHPNCQPKGMADTFLCRFQLHCQNPLDLPPYPHFSHRFEKAIGYHPFMSLSNSVYELSDTPRQYFEFLVELASNMRACLRSVRKSQSDYDEKRRSFYGGTIPWHMFQLRLKEIYAGIEVSTKPITRYVPVLTYGLSYQKVKKNNTAQVMKFDDEKSLNALTLAIGIMSLIGMRKKPPRAGEPKEFFSKSDTLNFLDPNNDTHGVSLVYVDGKIYISIRHGRLVAAEENVDDLKIYGVDRFDDESVNAVSVSVGMLFVSGSETLEIRDVDGFRIMAVEHDVDNPHLRTVSSTEEEYNTVEQLVQEYYS